MTKEGRLKTHLNELKLSRKSPYEEEFKDIKKVTEEVKPKNKKGKGK